MIDNVVEWSRDDWSMDDDNGYTWKCRNCESNIQFWPTDRIGLWYLNNERLFKWAVQASIV